MYESLKSIGKFIIPNSFLKKNDLLLRSIFSLYYLGSSYTCNLCHFSMRKFITLKNGDKLCPKCGSLPRSRRLWDTIQDQVKGKSVLHFSPCASIKKRIEESFVEKYYSTDFANEFEADYHYDLENIPEQDQSFDIIICYHILEHIENDLKAMSELYRVLKSKGQCFIQTPFSNDDELYENANITTKSNRLKHFGQEDHVRIYSVEALQKRLAQVGFIVSILNFKIANKNSNGFKEEEYVILCTK